MKYHVLILSVFVLTLTIQSLALDAFADQADYFLQIDDIRGNAVVNGKDGWIELERVQYNETDLDFVPGYANGTDVKFEEPQLTLIKQVDETSVSFIDALYSGIVFENAQLVLCYQETCYEPIPMTKIHVLHYSVNGIDESLTDSIIISFESKSANTVAIPGWIKNNAKWFGDGLIGESDFTKGIEFMIKEKIMNIPNLPPSASGVAQSKVPDWIKNNAKWWSDGLISDDDFVKGIQFLVEKGIIKVN